MRATHPFADTVGKSLHRIETSFGAQFHSFLPKRAETKKNMFDENRKWKGRCRGVSEIFDNNQRGGEEVSNLLECHTAREPSLSE